MAIVAPTSYTGVAPLGLAGGTGGCATVVGLPGTGPGSAGAGFGPRSTWLRTPPSSAMARSAMSAGNGLPCQPFLFSTSEKPLPLMVLARITVGWLPAVSAATVIALSMAARSWPSTVSTSRAERLASAVRTPGGPGRRRTPRWPSRLTSAIAIKFDSP